jgi:hypothetical protein
MNFYGNTTYIYGCAGQLSFFGNPGILDDVEGDHEEGKTPESVEALSFFQKRIFSLPKNLAEFFPNLKAMAFTLAEFSSISSSDLKPFPDLFYFSSLYNDVVSIEGDLFKHNPKLWRLSFDYNKLESVGHNLIRDLRWLQYANFRSNPCIDSTATSPSDIHDLNLQLPIRCPPIPTTTTEVSDTTKMPETCQLRCSLNDETDELKDELTRINTKLSEKDETIASMKEKIEEIERKLRELAGSPSL